MATRIKFDSTHNVQPPTFVLATRGGRKLGKLPAYNISFNGNLNSYSEVFFRVNKADCTLNQLGNNFWNKIKDFKLVYCKEYDAWFEIYVEIEESNHLIKNVTAKSLGEAELSQINLYDVEINTETDIAREDYEKTVLFDETNQKASTMHRIMDKAPHYKIAHVDASIAGIQRTFSFDSISIYDAFQEISTELNCLFLIKVTMDSDGKICRQIEVHDLEAYCFDCGKRGEFSDVCPECGSSNILPGYGEDTTIFVSTDNLASDIRYSVDTNSVKNCFRLAAGDELMTATLANCNPNGTGYIWYISDVVKEDMPYELVTALNDYDKQYAYYQQEHQTIVSSELLSKYNELVSNYSGYSDTLDSIPESIVGYPKLMNAYYNTLDMHMFLTHELMPDISIQDTTAEIEAAKLNSENMTQVSVQNIDKASATTVTNAVLAMAKTLVDSRYQVKVNESQYGDAIWEGNFIVTNYSDAEDYAVSNKITVIINDNYERYIKQRIDKLLSGDSYEGIDIVSLFNLELSGFTAEIKKYCLRSLSSFHDACQACLNILIEQGVADSGSSDAQKTALYNSLYLPFFNKLSTLEEEIKTRESEIAIVIGEYNSDGELVSDGIQTIIEKERKTIQEALDFEKYLGEELWLEFVSYRREDIYQNENFISDGLNNAELFERALEFIEIAKKDIFRSATLQHSITATLKNLLVMKEFSAIVDHFEVGNWIRIRSNGEIFKLRIVHYEIDYDNIENISITFSDVKSGCDGISDAKSIISQAASMATSYGAVSRQASQGKKSNAVLNNWIENGLNATNTKIVGADNQNQVWDKNGILCRQYDPITETYDDEQLKIINSTIAITDDKWNSTKTAIGKFYYVDPNSGELKVAYGINGETLVGKILLGESLGLYNGDNSMSFDVNGLVVKNDINTFIINPSNDSLVTAYRDGDPILLFDENGNLIIDGSIYSSSGQIGGFTITSESLYNGIDSLKGDVEDGANGVYVGTDGIRVGDDLKLNANGTLVSGSRMYVKNGHGIRGIKFETDSATIQNSNCIAYINTNDRIILGHHENSSATTICSPSDIYLKSNAVTSDSSRYVLKFTKDAIGDEEGGFFMPSYNTSDGISYTNLGGASHKWRNVFAANGEITTSDRNQKRDIHPLSDKYIEIFDLLEPVSYKTLDGDRTHTGFVAQDVEEALEHVGLTSDDFAGLCKDVKTADNDGETRIVLDSTGNPSIMYSLRYSEFIALNTAKIKQLEQTIIQLQNEIESLKPMIDSIS